MILIPIIFIAHAGCNRVPNENGQPSLNVIINVPDQSAGEATAPAALAKKITLPQVSAQGWVIPPPAAEAVHIMLTLTNPDETFYIYNYEPGTPVSVMVTSGQAREIYVEAYRIPTGPAPTDFNALHYVTVTPLEQRTIDFLGEPITLTIDTALDNDLGQVYEDPPFPLIMGAGDSVLLPLSSTCPPASDFWVNVTDLAFSFTFPSINIILHDGQAPLPLSLNGLPKHRTYLVQVFHQGVGIAGAFQTMVGDTVQQSDLVFTQYFKPQINLLPEKSLVMLIPGDRVNVGLDPEAGLGGFGQFTLGPSDTCAGTIAGATYNFTVPATPSCVIHVMAQDCSARTGQGQAAVTVDTTPPPACRDGIDNDYDGLSDYPADPGCLSPDENDELGTNECDDGVNNDSDGLIDINDPGCADPADPSELGTAQCDDGVNKDTDGLIDMNDPGCAGPTDTSEYGTVPCDDGTDNDGDGLADAADPGCASDGDTTEWRVWFVSTSGNNTTGLTWANAFNLAQTAMDAALAGDHVWVQQGTYYRPIGGNEPVLTMKDGINVYGGMAGTEVSLTDRGIPLNFPTILDGQLLSYHVVMAASNALLDGFIIRNGFANGAGLDGRGGGLSSDSDSNLTIANCRFLSNISMGYYAGAMWINDPVAMDIENSIFQNNVSSAGSFPSQGGAIVFRASYAANSFSAAVSNCLFINNSASSTNLGYGGAISSLSINSLLIENSTFSGNSAHTGGGAFYIWNYGTATLINNIMWGDNAPSGPEIYVDGGTAAANVSYSDVQGGYAGTGNINLNPLFTPSYRLSQTASGGPVDSPCLDAGSDTAANLGMNAYTTRQDGAADAGQADMGYHHPLGTTEPIIWFVSPSGSNASGLSWADAYTHPQTAMNAASAGQIILVKQGTYFRPVGGNEPVLTMKNGVNIYGGFIGNETSLADRGVPLDFPAVFDGENLSYHTVMAASSARLDVFTIQRGYANGGGVTDQMGGGVRSESKSNLTIANCRVVNNTSRDYGAGMWIGNPVNVTIENSVFQNNAQQAGLPSQGGAIVFYAAGVPNGYSASVSNCLFTGNSAPTSGYGGAVSDQAINSLLIENSTFSGNSASAAGGAFYIWNSGTATLINNIMWGDNAPSGPEIYVSGGSVNASYSDVQGGYTGTANINANPLFATGPRGSYYLTAGASPCIDAGSASAVSPGLDLFTTNILGLPDTGTVDMGWHYSP